MADKDTLWTAVKARYAADGLIPLTNILDRSSVAIDDAVGTEAANGTINLWPAYAQVAFDVADQLHIEAAALGTIAFLFRRGGTSSSIEQVKWDTVFSADGVIAKVKRTGPRGRPAPSTNSGVSQKSELLANGQRARPWADWASLPHGIRPQRRSSVDD